MAKTYPFQLTLPQATVAGIRRRIETGDWAVSHRFMTGGFGARIEDESLVVKLREGFGRGSRPIEMRASLTDGPDGALIDGTLGVDTGLIGCATFFAQLVGSVMVLVLFVMGLFGHGSWSDHPWRNLVGFMVVIVAVGPFVRLIGPRAYASDRDDVATYLREAFATAHDG